MFTHRYLHWFPSDVKKAILENLPKIRFPVQCVLLFCKYFVLGFVDLKCKTIIFDVLTPNQKKNQLMLCFLSEENITLYRSVNRKSIISIQY